MPLSNRAHSSHHSSASSPRPWRARRRFRRRQREGDGGGEEGDGGGGCVELTSNHRVRARMTVAAPSPFTGAPTLRRPTSTRPPPCLRVVSTLEPRLDTLTPVSIDTWTQSTRPTLVSIDTTPTPLQHCLDTLRHTCLCRYDNPRHSEQRTVSHYKTKKDDAFL